MPKNGHSEPNIFGGYTHYDSKGKVTGRSEPGIFGGFTDYDAKGNKIGHSEPGVFGGYTHYNNKGEKIGRSDPTVFGDYKHYDKSGKQVGRSDRQALGGFSNKSGADACYVATCVYGSYDCPEVWTLRRFRDSFLKHHFLGRAFIKIYYYVSPKIVARRGGRTTFRSFWRNILNKFVRQLNKRGYSREKYRDTQEGE